MKAILFLFLSINLFSCAMTEPTGKKALSGAYTIHVEIKDLEGKKEQMTQSINEGFDSVKKELDSAEIKAEFNTKPIDTSTIEGKIEYAATNMAQGLLGMTGELSELAASLVKMSGSLMENLLDGSKDMLNNLTADVELKEDGTIKVTGNSLLKMAASQVEWNTKDDHFILQDEKGIEKAQFQISDKTADGFKLYKDDICVVFKRKII